MDGGRWRVTRALSAAASMAMAAFSSESEKNCRFLSLAMIQRVTTCTLGLVARLVGPRRYDCRVVVGCHLGIAAVYRRLVEAGLGDAGFEIVGDRHRRYATEERVGAGV